MLYENKTEVINNLKEVKCTLCKNKRVGICGPKSMAIVMKTWFVKPIGEEAEQVAFICPECIDRALKSLNKEKELIIKKIALMALEDAEMFDSVGVELSLSGTELVKLRDELDKS